MARGGSVYVQLSAPEARLLSSLPDLLSGVGVDPRDPAGPRLNQSAYPDDPMASAEFEVSHSEQLASKRAVDRETLATTLPASVDGVHLDEEQAASWMRVVGDARLALAARLGVEDDRWERESSSDPQMVMVRYLTAIQSGLIEALSSLMDRSPDG